MKYPTMRFVFDRKKVATDKKKGLVQIEVLSERKRKFIGTNVKVYADQWHDRKKVVRSADAVRLNTMLDGQMMKLQDFIASLINKGIPFDFEKLEAFLDDSVVSESFIDFVEKRVEERADIEESTRKQHRTLIHSLEEFGRMNYTSDLTAKNITIYQEFLLRKGISQATAYNYIKRLKVYINEAIRFGMIEKDPTMGMRFKRGKFDKRKYLTDEELESVKTCPINSKPIERIRDLFLFQCYTGLAYADFAKFNFKQDVEKRGEKFVIADRRQKTNEDYFIVLLTPAMKILQKYDYELPIISNQKYNVNLKVLAQYAGIEKNLTSHVARHTFGVFALNHGVNIEVLAKMMGHSNIKTTQIYAKVLNKSVEQGFDVLEKAVK